MKPALIKKFILLLIVFAASGFRSQPNDLLETRYAIETTFDDKAPVVFEENYGALKYNSNSGDLNFITNLAGIKTGNAKLDSLLVEQEQLFLSFQANLGQNFTTIVGEENDDQTHRIVGTVLVNNLSYPVDAYVSIKNLVDRSSPAKLLLDLSFAINPKVVIIPLLSGYFNNVMLFQIDDGVINQNN